MNDPTKAYKVQCRMTATSPWRDVPSTKYTKSDIQHLNTMYGFEKYRIKTEEVQLPEV